MELVRVAGSLTVALVALLAVPLTVTALSFEEPFSWAPGDRWQYDGESTVSGGPQATVSVQRVVEGEAMVERPNRTIEALRVVTELSMVANASDRSGTSGQRSTETTWVRAHDHALVRTHAEVTLHVGGRVQEQNGTSDYRPPCATERWPMTVGAFWIVDCPREDSGHAGNTTTRLEHGVRVLRSEEIDVPAGTFEALVLERRASNGATTTEWWAAEACGQVKRITRDQDSTLTLELVSVRCAAVHGIAGEPGDGPGETSPPQVPLPGAPVLVSLLAATAVLARRRLRPLG